MEEVKKTSNKNGKGSKQRPTNLKKFGENYDKIFRKKVLKSDIKI